MSARKKKPIVRDRHRLYSAAVQSVDADLDFFARVYKKKRGRPFLGGLCHEYALAPTGA